MPQFDFWHEFFLVEEMTGRTVNNIIGPTMDGTSIKVYLYLLVGLSVFTWVMYDLFRSLSVDWKDLGRKILILVFAFWAAMEARSALNYISYFRNDLVQLYGKSLDQKRSLTSPEGLFEFTQFIKKEIPPGKTVGILHPRDEYIDLKIYYYLHPIEKVDPARADYVAGYMSYPKNIKIWKQSRYGWIVKK
jgi:hypothetical protein